jgi:hypothetical protein
LAQCEERRKREAMALCSVGEVKKKMKNQGRGGGTGLIEKGRLEESRT